MNRRFCILATREVIELSTSFECPPIPTRAFDWSAVDADTYDADWDGDRYVSASPHGHGATEMEAVNDLLAQMELKPCER